jgi:hypothetical protein
MSTFGKCERGGHDHHHHHRYVKRQSSIPTVISTKTDLENVKYSSNDTPKARKVKFMFRVGLNN